MTRMELEQAVQAAADRAAAALQTVYDALNQGQRKKLLKDETVAALLELYGVVL